MKHIQESIIGRKGISGIPILQQGDIVITQRGDIYMVLTDYVYLKKLLHPNSFSLYDMTKGAFVCKTGKGFFSDYMNISAYDDELKEIDGNGDYDVEQVWRNPKRRYIDSNDDLRQIIQIENLKLLQKSYKLIWKR